MAISRGDSWKEQVVVFHLKMQNVDDKSMTALQKSNENSGIQKWYGSYYKFQKVETCSLQMAC